MNNEQTVKKPDTPYRKTFVLKQQTPMIHFQHADSGVVIRASEFKPKLDKFLLMKLNGNLSGKEKWFLKQADGNQEIKAFNYKVRIFATGEPERSDTIERDIEKNRIRSKNSMDRDKVRKLLKEVDARYSGKTINSMYFGNMVNARVKNYPEEVKKAYKETIFYRDDIYVEIQCFVRELLVYIDANISEFLLVTNFGTRQSKGFGCFSLKNYKDPINILEENQYNFIYGEITQSTGQDKAYKDVALEVAAGIYAVMKGGINRSKGRDGTYDKRKYIKGYIQRQYLDEIKKNDIGSDKAFMKKDILPSSLREIEKNSDNFEEYTEFEYVRAILGIPESIEFKDPDQKRNGTVEIKGDNIERFQSAIQIVISGKYVILIMKDSYKAILGKEFVFSTEIGNGTIKVPSEFNPEKFLSGFVKYYNREKWKLKHLNYQEASKIELRMEREGKK